MNIFNDLLKDFPDSLYLAKFVTLSGLCAIVFYMLGQYWDRFNAARSKRRVLQSLRANQRLSKELRGEVDIHRRIANRYKEAFDKKETHWLKIKANWEEDAGRNKRIVNRLEHEKTKCFAELKHTKAQLVEIQKAFEENKEASRKQIALLKQNCSDKAVLEEAEAQARREKKNSSKR